MSHDPAPNSQQPTAHMPVYEVFRQEREGEPMQHHGSVLAPSADLARQYARDFFSRRNEALRLWVVPREAMDAEVDSMFQVRAAGLNVLNVVDSWIDDAALARLVAEKPWDLVLWPF